MRVPLAVFELEVDGRVLHSTTRGLALGARVVALSSAVPALGLELHSTYLGAAAAGTHAAHLVLASELTAHQQVDHRSDALPVELDRGALVLDHAATLQAAAHATAGETVLLHVDDDRLGQLLRRGVAPAARGPDGVI